MGVILIKTVFLPKVSHIQPNYVFLLFWSIFGEIHRELLFLDQKLAISERRTEILTKFVFLNMFENGKILKKIWMYLNISFWSNQWKGTNIKKKNFSPQSEPYKLKYVFVLFCSIFAEIHRELLFLDQKVTISERKTEILTKFVFLNMFENGQILRKNWICLNNCFWSNQRKGTNIKQKLFFPPKWATYS